MPGRGFRGEVSASETIACLGRMKCCKVFGSAGVGMGVGVAMSRCGMISAGSKGVLEGMTDEAMNVMANGHWVFRGC